MNVVKIYECNSNLYMYMIGKREVILRTFSVMAIVLNVISNVKMG